MTQSPRFLLRRQEISSVINKSRLKQTWKGKVRAASRDQFIPDPIDFYDLQVDINRVSERLEDLVLSGGYVPRAPKRITQEKSKGLCRLLTVPHPIDMLVLQCLSDALYADIKGKEPTKKAFFEPEDHSLSDGQELFTTPQYGSFKAWLNFQEELLKFASKKEWIVITDIANYYDFINYTHLRNVIAGTIPIRESILDFLIFVLSSMLWQPDYTPRFEIGLPQVNSDGPRILAHCFLFELDKVVTNWNGLEYARFMDDIDIGVDDYKQAKLILKQIDLVLQTRQIRLNSGKTKILSKKDAERHFCVRENAFLNKLVASINSKHQAHLPLDREARFVSFAIAYGARNGNFIDGNGEKILKRLLTMAGRLKAAISPANFLQILQTWPTSRENAMRYFQQVPHDKELFLALIKYMHERNFVDDITWLTFSKSVVSANMPNEKYVFPALESLFPSDTKRDFFELYAQIWILSKYGTSNDLLKVLKNNFDTWVPDGTLGRLVGSLGPLFEQDGMLDPFVTLINSSHNIEATQSMSFHLSVKVHHTQYARVRNYMRKSNPSLANAITHAKYIMLVNVLQGYSIDEAERKNLLQIHHKLFLDGYYAMRLGPLIP